MVLPFAVDQVERDIRDTLPSVSWGNAPLGEETTGVPQAIASSTGMPKPSTKDG